MTQIQPNSNVLSHLHINNVYNDILTFLSDPRLSEGTREGYLFDIKLFFSYHNKNIENLSPNDLHFEHKDIIRYRNYLINQKGYEKSTVNRKIASLNSLYTFFRRNKYDTKYNIDCNIFDIPNLKHKTNSYGDITPNELENMLKLVLSQVKGYEKQQFMLLATRTSIREGALLSLEWDDIIYNETNNHYFVHTYDKNTTERYQPISHELYQSLLKIKELKYYGRYNDNKIFHLTVVTLNNMMKTLCEQLGIEEHRNIAVHSLRNYASNYILNTSGDLKQAQLQLGHSSIETTWKHYVSKYQDVENSVSLLLDEKINEDAFNMLSCDEIKMLLNGTTNGIRLHLLREATRIINNRK